MSKSLALLAFLSVAACGGKSAAPTTAAEPAPEDDVPPDGMAFKDMSHAQRASFMTHTVLPAMKQTFQTFDAEEFADFGCETCHGAGAEDKTFEMPNPALPVLPGTEEAFMTYMQDPAVAPWVKFMMEEVKPQMARLLQVTEFDPTTNTGEFGCHGCHTIEGHAE